MGHEDVPSGPEGHFSKNNWFQRSERQDGRNIVVNITHIMVKIANRLKPEQWSLIIQAATSHAKQKKVINLSMANDLMDKTLSSNIEIINGDFDSDPEMDLEVDSVDEDSNADGSNSSSDIDMENDSN